MAAPREIISVVLFRTPAMIATRPEGWSSARVSRHRVFLVSPGRSAMGMRFGMGTRRAALDGLTRILDAGALEDLFTGPDDDAAFVYDLLVEVARGRASSCYWEICRTGRRRGVSPEYVSDRAAVLLASIEERRRIDAYRILGVAALAAPEAILPPLASSSPAGHRTGGDPARFRA
jgi:hypothetical protein